MKICLQGSPHFILLACGLTAVLALAACQSEDPEDKTATMQPVINALDRAFGKEESTDLNAQLAADYQSQVFASVDADGKTPSGLPVKHAGANRATLRIIDDKAYYPGRMETFLATATFGGVSKPSKSGRRTERLHASEVHMRGSSGISDEPSVRRRERLLKLDYSLAQSKSL